MCHRLVGCEAQLAERRERRSLAGELTRPALDLQLTGDHYVKISQLGQLSLSPFRGR